MSDDEPSTKAVTDGRTDMANAQKNTPLLQLFMPALLRHKAEQMDQAQPESGSGPEAPRRPSGGRKRGSRSFFQPVIGIVGIVVVVYVLTIYILIPAGGYICQSSVKTMTAEALQVLAGPAQTISVEDVQFDPFERTITAAGWNAAYASEGGLQALKGGNLFARLTVRGVMLHLPVIGALFGSAGDSVEMVEVMTIDEVSMRGREYQFDTAKAMLANASLPCSVARELAGRTRPSSGRVIDGLKAGKVLAESVRILGFGEHAGIRGTADSIEYRELAGTSAAKALVNNLSLDTSDRRLVIEELTIDSPHLTQEALNDFLAGLPQE